MKSRSNRVATSDPPDDWVDGSWTVDCICGVNFDDGEEMVNCDECSVWVHTRCFRFTKGEKSFACDKCKNKSIRNNDSEETEVAQLLVELPTKTIKMSSSNNNNNNNNSSSHSNSINHRGNHSNVYGGFGNQPPRRPPCRLWVNMPMEERVHVQGVPGGEDDPSLFQGFPILFASELWKCTGYVPKKLNFKYKEFPCWDKEVEVEVEEEQDVEVNATAKVEGGTESVVDRGAGVLFSLSKENVALSMKRGEAKSGGGLDKKGSKDKKLDTGDPKKSVLSKKEKGSILIHCNKRSRDELGSLKDRSGKKTIKAIRREQDSNKDNLKAVVHSSSARQVEVSENKAHKVASNAHLAEGSHIEKPKRNAADDEGNAVRRSPEVSGLGCSSEKRVKTEIPGHDVTASVVKSVKTEIAPLPVADKEGTTRDSTSKEGIVLDATDNNEAALQECQNSDPLKSKPHAEGVDSAIPELNNGEAAKDVETTVPLLSENCSSKTKSDADVDNPKGVLRSHPSDIDVDLEVDGMKHFSEQAPSPDRECQFSKPNEAVTISSQSHEHEYDGQHNDKILEAVSCSQVVKDEVTNENQCIDKVKSEGSENPIEVQRSFSDSKEVLKVAGDTLKPSVEILPPPSSHHKAVSVGKSSPSSSTMVASRSVLSNKNRAGSSQYHSSIGKRVTSNSSMATKKDNASLDQVKDEIKYEKTKSSTIPISKPSQPSKSVTSPVLKHHGKDSPRHPFTKKSAVESALLPSGVDESVGAQTQHTSSGQNKNNASGGQHRNEKTLQPNLQSSSKSNHASSGHPPPSSNAPAGLSDEELALLLHQELNSSPRVPRVPRVRHTGSLPQTSSASATSIFIKRGTSSGGKDQYTFSRRKNKDGSRSSRDQDSEARKADRVPSSPDSAKTSDTLTQAEGQSESTQSVRKNVDDNSLSVANSRPSSADAKKLKSSSTRDSSVNNHEDDTGNNKCLPPIHRTLPGLIAEIMGAGRRMTYEELCNAVLPHWQNLRKHNGERYAYSSHSQAVLDCLRNRSEWSRLVDRGPKTNASRKKRKTDVEPSNTESEDGEDRNQRVGKSKSFESNKEDYPKGRRKARKRRRLALRGRGVRDDRKRTKVQAGSDDTGSFSNSTEDTDSSEDDSHGSGMCAAKSEVSASSADMVAAQ